MPEVNHLGDKLEWPTYMETQLVSPVKTIQQLVQIYRSNCPPDGRPLAMKAHGVAFAGPDPADLRKDLPVRASEMPQYLNLVCLNEVRDRADMEQRLHGVPAVKVRGPVVHAWSHYVAHTNRRVQLDQAALQEYDAAIYQQPGGAVPPPVAAAAVATQRADVAGVLQAAFLHDRAGNAAVRQGEDELVAARRLQGQDRRQAAEAVPPAADTRPFVGLAQRPLQEAASGGTAAAASPEQQQQQGARSGGSAGAGGAAQRPCQAAAPSGAPPAAGLAQPSQEAGSGGTAAAASPEQQPHQGARSGGSAGAGAAAQRPCQGAAPSGVTAADGPAQQLRPGDDTAADGFARQPQQAGDSAGAAAAVGQDGALDELELVVPQGPPPVQPGSAHSDPGSVHELLRKGLVVHCAGGPRAPVLRESSPRILSDAYPTALPYAWGGQRPVCMTLPAYLRHLNARVPRRQFSGNASFLVRVGDVKVKHDIRASTAITARMAPEVVQQAGTLPHDFAKHLGDVLSMPSYDERRQRLLDQGGSVLRSFLSGAEKIAGRVEMTDAYYRSAQQQLRCASLQLGLPMLWWNINPSDMYADAVVVAGGQVSTGRGRSLDGRDWACTPEMSPAEEHMNRTLLFWFLHGRVCKWCRREVLVTRSAQPAAQTARRDFHTFQTCCTSCFAFVAHATGAAGLGGDRRGAAYGRQFRGGEVEAGTREPAQLRRAAGGHQDRHPGGAVRLQAGRQASIQPRLLLWGCDSGGCEG